MPSSLKSIQPLSPCSKVQRDYFEEDGSAISTIVRSTLNMMISNLLFGTLYNTWASIHDDDSLASFLVAFNYMQVV